MKTLALTFALILATLTGMATPFYFSSFNADGSPQTNVVTMQAWPPNQNGVTIYGTNIIYGAAIYSNTPNASGFFSNSLYPNLYKLTIPAITNSFFVLLLDTTNYLSLAVYATNVAVSGGTPLTSYGFVTNALGYAPVVPTYSGVTNALGFAPATNNILTNRIVYVSAVTGVTNASGYVTNLTVTLTTNTIYYQAR